MKTTTTNARIVVTSETLADALLAWDAWERAAVDAAHLVREGTADHEAWNEVGRLREAAMAYEAPRRLLSGTAEERVLRNALDHARETAEDRVLVYAADLLDAQVGAGGEDADG